MLRIDNIKIYTNEQENDLKNYVLSKYKINESDVLSFLIAKKSVDARDKNNIHFNYTINIKVKNESKYKKYLVIEDIENKNSKLNKNILKKDVISNEVVIVGAGPSRTFLCT